MIARAVVESVVIVYCSLFSEVGVRGW